jgi:hypothetical protein
MKSVPLTNRVSRQRPPPPSVQTPTSPNSPEAVAAEEPKTPVDATAMAPQAPNPRVLTPEEYEAVHGGFVEILDPRVQVCMEGRMDAFRDAEGPDAPLTYATHNEMAIECGWRLDQQGTPN